MSSVTSLGVLTLTVTLLAGSLHAAEKCELDTKHSFRYFPENVQPGLDQIIFEKKGQEPRGAALTSGKAMLKVRVQGPTQILELSE